MSFPADALRQEAARLCRLKLMVIDARALRAIDG